MTVLRIVPNIATGEPHLLRDFYQRVFGLDPVMDHGWIVTLAGHAGGPPQLSVASEGGSGAPVPHLSIEVDDLDAVLAAAKGAGAPIRYGPISEPWGVRRFFVQDPAGTVINVLAHE